jgi:PAS domain S-box-containing protein
MKQINPSNTYLNNILHADLPVSFYWMDREGTILQCNAAQAHIYGFDSSKELIGKSTYFLRDYFGWSEEMCEAIRRNDIAVMESGKTVVKEENVTVQGEKRTYLSHKSPLLNDEGNVIGVFGFSVDITAEKEAEALRSKQALINSAAQISHDIRSPLAALNTVLRNLSTVPEDQRILIRNAVRRINDIANNLLVEYRDESKGSSASSGIEPDQTIFPELLSSLLDTLISEKKAQVGDRDIELNLEIDALAFGSFVKIDPILFKRTISNLLNNAIEAIENRGEVSIKLEKRENYARISVQDTGKGIPPDVLEKIKQGGMSLDKEGGTGIGISSSLVIIKKCGGNFDMLSKPNEGTTVIIDLPIAPAPSWFQEQLILQPGTILAVVDDDESIHAIWTLRCRSFLSDITLKHFHHSKALDEYCKTTDLSKTQFLVDYELLDSPEVGLELIERLNLGNCAILVTSRYEEAKVRAHADKLGVKIIPKNYSPFIPISLASNDMPKLVFIDDDKNLTSAWESAAKYQGIVINTYNRTADFRKALPALAKNTPIYIDSNLREAASGEDFAKELSSLGFTELYIASGHPREHFGDLPWIKDFVSKEPPF